MGDMNLDEIAEQELLNEAKRGAARASVYGALGWQKCPLKPTNKVFLQNILLSTLSSKRQKDSDPDSQDNSKNKLSDDDLKDHSFRRHGDLCKKKAERSLLKERRTIHSFRDCEALSREGSKLDKLDSSSWKRKFKISNSVSVDLHSIRKERRQDNKNKLSVTLKHTVVAKKSSLVKEGNK